MRVLAGTSGFSYKEWRGSFYPEDVSANDVLRVYAERLPAVEINNTFYRMPRESVVEGWAAQVPDDFRFSIKATRRITHIKRLKGVEEEVGYLLNALQMLGPKLGIVLFQLPPNFKADPDVLDAFLQLLPPGAPAAFEFRHESWDDDAIRARLAQAGATLCQADVDDAPEPELFPTTERGYVRLRRAQYDREALARWVDRVRSQPWKDAYVFFKHEDEGVGPALAQSFLELWNG